MKKPLPDDLRKVNVELSLRSTKLYLKILRLVLTRYHEVTGTPPLTLGLLRSKDYRALYQWADSISAQSYADAKSTYLASQVAALIRKYPWPKDLLDLDPEGTAIRTFYKSEHKCRRMNTKFRLTRVLRDPRSEETQNMRAFIRGVIGRKPIMRDIYESCDFGKGASIGVSGIATHLGKKLLSEMSVTPCARDYVIASLPYNFHFASAFLPKKGEYMSYDIEAMLVNIETMTKLVPNNKISFVPKTAKTHRAIAVEPVLNGYIQKGIDLVMRKKLARAGIDLTNQEINAEMARKGSLSDDDDSFVTIDLSSASDSVSIGLVKHLLPPAWFDLLNRVRSPSFRISDGAIQRYQKFCSMGNGFCFPLETLIFVSICHVAGAGVPFEDYHVYGDDIIVRKRYADAVLEKLHYYGFTPNVRKTFVTGPFRESCGSNWYVGESVNSFTLDFALDSVQALFKFLNLSRRNKWYTLLFPDAQSEVLKRIPESFRFERPFTGPEDTAIDRLDGLLFSSPDSTVRPRQWNRRYQTEEWYELLSLPVYDKEDYPNWVVMAGAVRGCTSDPNGNLFTFRRKSRTVIRLVPGGAAA